MVWDRFGGDLSDEPQDVSRHVPALQVSYGPSGTHTLLSNLCGVLSRRLDSRLSRIRLVKSPQTEAPFRMHIKTPNVQSKISQL